MLTDQNNHDLSKPVAQDPVLKPELEIARLEAEGVALAQSIIETQKAIEVLESSIHEKIKQIELSSAELTKASVNSSQADKLVKRDDNPLATKQAELNSLKNQVGKVSGLQAKLKNQPSNQVEKPELEALKQQKGRISGLLGKLAEKNQAAVEPKKAELSKVAKPVANKFKKDSAAQLPKPEVIVNALPAEPVDKKQELSELHVKLETLQAEIQAEMLDKEAMEAAMRLVEKKNSQLTFQFNMPFEVIKPKIIITKVEEFEAEVTLEKANEYKGCEYLETPISEEDYDKACQERIKKLEAEEESNRRAIQLALNN